MARLYIQAGSELLPEPAPRLTTEAYRMTESKPSAPDGKQAAQPSRRTPLRRAESSFMTDPASTRNAIFLIVAVDLAIVLVGGTVIWLFDRQEYEHLGEALWYTLQTITTVGYGDVTPTEPIGRLVGAGIMMLGIAFLSILTATITSSFIEARSAARRALEDLDDRSDQARLEARLDAMNDRFDRLEELVRTNRDAGA
jgi:voltage-gated potassium channel